MSDEMSVYERNAWQRIALWKESKLAERNSRVPAFLRTGVEKAKDTVGAGWDYVPGHDEIEATLLACVQGLHGMVADTAAYSVSGTRVRDAYREAGFLVDELEDIQKLDLENVDDVTPSLGYHYALSLAGEGAAAGFAVGGGTMLATAGGVAGAGAGAVPGIGLTVGLFSADIAALLFGSTRSVAHYAIYHGYNPREPGERAFMLGVLTTSLLTGHAAKTAGFADLHKLVGLLAREATWDVLGKDPMVRLTSKMFSKLGERLTKKKMGTVVPVAGTALGAGLNYRYVRDVTDHAYWLYRERFLMDKYRSNGPEEPPDVDVVDLEVLADDEDADDERDGSEEE